MQSFDPCLFITRIQCILQALQKAAVLLQHFSSSRSALFRGHISIGCAKASDGDELTQLPADLPRPSSSEDLPGCRLTSGARTAYSMPSLSTTCPRDAAAAGITALHRLSHRFILTSIKGRAPKEVPLGEDTSRCRNSRWRLLHQASRRYRSAMGGTKRALLGLERCAWRHRCGGGLAATERQTYVLWCLADSISVG